MTLGEKIQLCRKKMGMSQEDLANILNVSRQAVQKWESGVSQPELNKIIQLSNILDVSTDYLLKDIEIKEDKKAPVEEKVKTEEVKYTGEKRLDPKRITFIKVWMIIGCVLTPLAAGGSYLNNQYKPEAFLFLFMYLITIPLCVAAINKCKRARSQEDLIALGIVCALFVSFLGGIFMLASGDRYFIPIEDNSASKAKESEKKVAEMAERIDKREKEQEEERKNAKNQADQASFKSEACNKVMTQYHMFEVKQYHPDDIHKAEVRKSEVIHEIVDSDNKEDIERLIEEYKDYLSTFNIDEAYYQELKKKKRDRGIIFLVVVATAASMVGEGFAIREIVKLVSKNVTYNKAIQNMNSGHYQEAFEQLKTITNYKDAQNKISVARGLIMLDAAITTKRQRDIIDGIQLVVEGKETVNITYHSEEPFTIRDGAYTYSEIVSNVDYSLVQPSYYRGYSFKNWYSTSLKYENQTYIDVSAVFAPTVYTIKYTLNGGVNSKNNPSAYTIRSKDIVLEDPTREDYIFLGWYDDDEEKVEIIPHDFCKNVHLTARWEEESK